MTRVLPEPAPARISRGPSVAFTASTCCGFSEDKISINTLFGVPRSPTVLLLRTRPRSIPNLFYKALNLFEPVMPRIGHHLEQRHLDARGDDTACKHFRQAGLFIPIRP